jgi:hypothetical protein
MNAVGRQQQQGAAAPSAAAPSSVAQSQAAQSAAAQSSAGGTRGAHGTRANKKHKRKRTLDIEHGDLMDQL